MLTLARSIGTFPNAVIASCSGGLPVEVTLISQLGHGRGDALIAVASVRQKRHPAFRDELDEPSARIASTDFRAGEATALYTFAVGQAGHPFHRHAGHRVFTAVSGSAGAQLRFSTASDAQIRADPRRFVQALRYVNIPPDCLFTLRFGGGTWHQFVPLAATGHPALFAVSCHTDEAGGDLPPALRARVLADEADIPALTEVLPDHVQALLRSVDERRVPTVALSLEAPALSPLAGLCAAVRGVLGHARGAWSRTWPTRGSVADNGGGRDVRECSRFPGDTLVAGTFADGADHEDRFTLTVHAGEIGTGSATAAMLAVLDGFMHNRPLGVSRLMSLRNALVRPLGLRTSPLGCPVSSLLAEEGQGRFGGRYPVLAQRVSGGDRRAEVLLGADDRHLQFRSGVGVAFSGDGSVEFSLATRVRTRNLFGRVYLALIDRVHRRYVAPAMLRLAVDHALRRLRSEAEADAPRWRAVSAWM